MYTSLRILKSITHTYEEGFKDLQGRSTFRKQYVIGHGLAKSVKYALKAWVMPHTRGPYKCGILVGQIDSGEAWGHLCLSHRNQL